MLFFCLLRYLQRLQRTVLKVKLMTEEPVQRLWESLTATPALKKIRKSVLEVMSLNARLIAYHGSKDGRTQRQSDARVAGTGAGTGTHQALECKEESKSNENDNAVDGDDTTPAPLAGLAVVAAPSSTDAGEDDEARSATHIPGSTVTGAVALAPTLSPEAESARAEKQAPPASPKEADKADPTAPAPANTEESQVVGSPAEVTSPAAIPKEAEEVDPTAPSPTNHQVGEAVAGDTSPHTIPHATTEAHATAPAPAHIGADITSIDGYNETREDKPAAPTLPPTAEDLGELSADADQLSRNIKPEDTEDDEAATRTQAFGLVLVTAAAPLMIHDSDSDPEPEARDMLSCHMVAL